MTLALIVLILRVVMLIAGIVLLIVGHLPVTPSRAVRGAAARFLGAILLVPFIAVFIIGFYISYNHEELRRVEQLDRWWRNLAAADVIIVGVGFAIAGLFVVFAASLDPKEPKKAPLDAQTRSEMKWSSWEGEEEPIPEARPAEREERRERPRREEREPPRPRPEEPPPPRRPRVEPVAEGMSSAAWALLLVGSANVLLLLAGLVVFANMPKG